MYLLIDVRPSVCLSVCMSVGMCVCSDDAAGDYANTRLVLQELSINDVTLDDCRYVQHVCWQVSQRAAHLAAAGKHSTTPDLLYSHSLYYLGTARHG